jgi:undecaprenyl-diphosphatase
LQTVDQILSLIEQYGYLIVFLGVLLESAGVPLPGETILLASGVLVQQGHLDLGDAPERLERAERFFDRHGGKAVFLARFVAGLRVFAALVAGISRMRWRTFFFYNALGGATWATVAVLAGYLLSGSVDLVARWTGRASILLAILLVLALVLYMAYRWTSTHPEQLRRTFRRIGGERMDKLLQSPVGLWIKRRFSPQRVYGLTLTIGLLLTGFFSWAFGAIVQDVVNQDPLVQVDQSVLRFVHSHSESYLTLTARIFETLLSPEVLLSVGAAAGLVLAVLAYRRGGFYRGFSGALLLATAFGTGALAELLKLLFHRPRPPASLQLVPQGGYGFPSSHAMAAVAVGAASWYLFSLRSPESWGGSWRAKARVGFAVVVVALLVGLGQVYTGAHYPSDVLAGWALGGLWASVCLTAAEVFRRLHESKSENEEKSIHEPG